MVLIFRKIILQIIRFVPVASCRFIAIIYQFPTPNGSLPDIAKDLYSFNDLNTQVSPGETGHFLDPSGAGDIDLN